MARRRTLWISLSLLGLVLFGTLVVLSSISYYLAIPDAAYIKDTDVDFTTRPNTTRPSPPERIPRIIHQTWKSETLPEKWKALVQGCRDMMPD
jgi:inositol phosphorylceramide mannosyltransferase catalytic subunit